jgi:hypothetical protein
MLACMARQLPPLVQLEGAGVYLTRLRRQDEAGVPPQASIIERGCKACVCRQYQAALAAEALGATSAAPLPPTTKGTKAAPLKTEQEAQEARMLVCAAGLSTACCLRVHPLVDSGARL